jgi:hypothetical protein
MRDAIRSVAGALASSGGPVPATCRIWSEGVVPISGGAFTCPGTITQVVSGVGGT